MNLKLEHIDALGLLYEKAKITLKCITLYDVTAAEMQLLAYIADDFLTELWDSLNSPQ